MWRRGWKWKRLSQLFPFEVLKHLVQKANSDFKGHLKQRHILTRIAKLKPSSEGRFRVIISLVSGPANNPTWTSPLKFNLLQIFILALTVWEVSSNSKSYVKRSDCQYSLDEVGSELVSDLRKSIKTIQHHRINAFKYHQLLSINNGFTKVTSDASDSSSERIMPAPSKQ